jgi:hypothetical protein
VLSAGSGQHNAHATQAIAHAASLAAAGVTGAASGAAASRVVAATARAGIAPGDATAARAAEEAAWLALQSARLDASVDALAAAAGAAAAAAATAAVRGQRSSPRNRHRRRLSRSHASDSDASESDSDSSADRRGARGGDADRPEFDAWGEPVPKPEEAADFLAALGVPSTNAKPVPVERERRGRRSRSSGKSSQRRRRSKSSRSSVVSNDARRSDGGSDEDDARSVSSTAHFKTMAQRKEEAYDAGLKSAFGSHADVSPAKKTRDATPGSGRGKMGDSGHRGKNKDNGVSPEFAAARAAGAGFSSPLLVSANASLATVAESLSQRNSDLERGSFTLRAENEALRTHVGRLGSKLGAAVDLLNNLALATSPAFANAAASSLGVGGGSGTSNNFGASPPPKFSEKETFTSPRGGMRSPQYDLWRHGGGPQNAAAHEAMAAANAAEYVPQRPSWRVKTPGAGVGAVSPRQPPMMQSPRQPAPPQRYAQNHTMRSDGVSSALNVGDGDYKKMSFETENDRYAMSARVRYDASGGRGDYY